MTSDAKIGLLLGLVFIFVIAFIINGLPNFGNHSQAEATPMLTFQDDKLGLADSAQTAQEQLDWDSLLEEEDATLANLEPVASEPAAESTETVAAGDDQEVRGVYPLDSLMGGFARTIGDAVSRISEASRSTTLQAEASEPAPVIEASTPEPTPQVAETRATEPETPAQRPATRTQPRIYVVEEGDVLATVAKKAYGPEEGNRLVNVNRIFEANRMTMKSPDEIFVGQKLIIPPLPKTGAGADATSALSGPLFERVTDIGRRNLEQIDLAKPQGRFYVVQDGDSLWKIAATQLGNGVRWEEIAKLNAEALKSKDGTLAIGMRLRLPAK